MTQATAASRRNLVLAAMMGAAVLLTYVDRGAIGIAAPVMKDELGLSATGFGLAVSAFFWVYAPVCLITGWLCDRYCVYRLFFGGVLLWALATLLTGFVSSLAMLVIFRIALGVGESIVFPASSKVIATQIPATKRGMANAMVVSGIAFGPAAGTLLGGILMAMAGWRAMFVIFGLLTLVWLLPWARITAALRSEALNAPKATPYPMGKLLRTPSLWAMGIGHFLSNYGFYFLLAWLPLYLVKTRGYSIEAMTALTTVGYLAQGGMALTAGWLSDRLVRRGADEGRMRKQLLAMGQVGCAIAIAGVYLSQSTAMLAIWLVLAGLSVGVLSTNLFALSQMFSGARAAGSWLGVQNAVANTAGIIGPILTGLIVDRLGSYGWAFAVASVTSLLGAVWWLLIVPKVRQIDTVAMA